LTPATFPVALLTSAGTAITHLSGVQLSWHCAFRIAFATMHVSRHSNHTTLCISFFLHFLRLPATFRVG